MQAALAASALVMGLVGGPHCVAMCGAACAGVIRLVRAPAGGIATLAPPAPSLPAGLLFHAGRVAGYAAAGAAAAASMQGLALASERLGALRPAWMLLHAFVLAWGLLLAASGRQPTWAHRAGRWAAARLQPMTRSPFGVLAAGALWVAMPCGLLYSALMLAALGNGVLEGAIAMALFAAGGAVSLLLAPWLFERLRAGAGRRSQQWGTRLAGAMLAALALQALWMDLAHQIEIWCR
ncbi:sulfite exporter TauE/SafE family protein [Variovorax saccharolyticus]|uniref:sulfite exporter TauE/SafE family protein n=1 Tax=Variovorax saccharolyticus TaxID=3053516 RepID=UPI002578B093|nr:sulfite exporter TauE/SafE family protein [Variovorax sp. J22R187]MDM0021613.1 sulfite exporter TauE/SafE family protein [Variovorax sp. J22R187]